MKGHQKRTLDLATRMYRYARDHPESTLEEIGGEFNYSREWTRQLCQLGRSLWLKSIGKEAL